jgi:hypothetical protein
MRKILKTFLDLSKIPPQKRLSPRRVSPTREQFRDAHPVDAWACLVRHAATYERQQRTRPRTFHPQTRFERKVA